MKTYLLRLIAVFLFLISFFYSSVSIAVVSTSRSTAYSDCNTWVLANGGYAGRSQCQQSTTGQSGYPNSIVVLSSCCGNVSNVWNYPAGVDCPVAGQTYNSTTHTCAVACVAGFTSSIPVPLGTVNADNILTRSARSFSTQVCYSGCLWNYNPDSSTVSSWINPTTHTYYKLLSATKTASSCSTDQSAVTSTSDTVAPVVEKPPFLSCITDKKGKEICSKTTAPGEGTINGATFKLKDGVDCQVVQGFADPLCAGFAKNCGRVNGKMVCVESNPAPSGTAPYDANKDPKVVCHEDILGFVHCMNDETGVKSSQTQTKSTDASGNVTITTTTTNNIQGDGDKVTTTITKPDGTSTTSTTGDPLTADNGTGDTNVKGADQTGTDSFFSGLSSQIAGSQVTGSSFIGNFFTLPSFGTCTSIPMVYKKLNITIDPCAKFAFFRDIFGWFLFVITGYLLIKIATDT